MTVRVCTVGPSLCVATPGASLLLRDFLTTSSASVRGLLVAGIQVFVPYRIHPSIHPSNHQPTPPTK